MTGFVYAFGSAVFAATSDALSKKALNGHSVLVTAWVRLAYSAPFLLPLLWFIEIPRLDRSFGTIILILIPLEIGAILLYMKALQISPLSLTVPFLSLTPVFTLLTSLLMLGEMPDLSGGFGVLLIAMGAFLMNAHLTKNGLMEPLKAILRERGSLLMVAVAFIYSITSNLGKLAIQHSSPVFMGVFYLPCVSMALLPMAVMGGMRVAHLRSGGALFWLIGASQAFMTLCHFKAVSMILVSYMISVKRLSLLLSVVFGGVLFQEEHLKERLFGSLTMLTGVIFILL
jgi:drug/metabolite transporter (DMT)-like permease